VLARFEPLVKPGGLLFAGHSENFSYVTHAFRLRGQTVYELARDSTALARVRTDVRPTLHSGGAAAPADASDATHKAGKRLQEVGV
jgi:chemotaxis protein methyltransferase CheR